MKCFRNCTQYKNEALEIDVLISGGRAEGPRTSCTALNKSPVELHHMVTALFKDAVIY